MDTPYTHTVLWWLFDDPDLDSATRALIARPDNEVYVSSVSAWEIATKHRIGKLPEATGILRNYKRLSSKARFRELDITIEHALKAGALPGSHQDPFDRMLAAQSLLEGFSIVSRDPVFQLYKVKVIPA